MHATMLQLATRHSTYYTLCVEVLQRLFDEFFAKALARARAARDIRQWNAIWIGQHLDFVPDTCIHTADVIYLWLYSCIIWKIYISCSVGLRQKEEFFYETRENSHCFFAVRIPGTINHAIFHQKAAIKLRDVT